MDDDDNEEEEVSIVLCGDINFFFEAVIIHFSRLVLGMCEHSFFWFRILATTKKNLKNLVFNGSPSAGLHNILPFVSWSRELEYTERRYDAYFYRIIAYSPGLVGDCKIRLKTGQVQIWVS